MAEKRRKSKSKSQQAKEIGLFGAVVAAGAAAASKRSKKGSKAKLMIVVICLAVIVCGTLYYFDISPFDFELFDGFKYYTYSVGALPSDFVKSDGELAVHFIDVGQGDCIFIQFPDGKTMLIDGGERRNAVASGVVQYLFDLYPQQDNVTIDYCMLTHTDSDHCGSLDDVIAHQQIDVKTIYQPRVLSQFTFDPLADLVEKDPLLYENLPQIDTGVYASFVEAVYNEVNSGVCQQIFYNFEGMFISGEGWGIYFYNPSEQLYADLASGGQTAFEKNNLSPVMVLLFNNKTILLTGDADEDAEQNFAQNVSMQFDDGFVWDGDCDVLKVAHHGGADSTLAPFLEIVQPEYAVICVGEDNKHDHPREETLDRLDDYVGENTFMTSQNGTILLTVTNTGELVWKFEKQP